MKRFIKLGAGILTMVIVMVSGAFADVIPYDLQWPLKNKGVADTSIFFNTEDAVDTPSGEARTCNSNGDRAKFYQSKTHFDRHAGLDIITNVGTKVYPVDDGYIVRIGTGKLKNGDDWKNYIVVEHNNNGKKWTSVYWHLQNKLLVKSKKLHCDKGHNADKYIKRECKVNRNTILGYTDRVSDMNDVNHLHIGLRPLPYDRYSVRGYGDGKNLHGFTNPLYYLPHPFYKLIDDNLAKYRYSWKQSNKLDLYSGIGYKETNKYGSKSIFYPVKDEIIKNNTTLKIYAKFPVANDRSKVAIYGLSVNGKWVKSVRIDQSYPGNRGHNVYLFKYTFKYGDRISIIGFNYDKNKTFISSDAILYVKQ